MHLGMRWMHVVVFHVVTLDLFVVLLIFPFFEGIHTIVLVGLTLVVLLLVSCEHLPSTSDQSSNAPSFRRDTSLGLLKAQDMSREEHVVPCLVTLSVGALVRRLVLRHFFFVAFAVNLGAET